MTAFAPIATLATPCTLLETDDLTIATQKLLLDGESIPGGVVLHHHIVTAGGFFFIDVPVAHMLALDLDDSTIIRLSDTDHGERYGIVFKHYHHALAYLAKHYGLAQAIDRAPASTDASPSSSVIVVPAYLSTPPRLTRRPLSTTAFSPFGVIHMSKKQPIRVFLDPETHSRHLIQAGTNGLTSSALSERLIEYGLAQLERGEKAPLEALARAASPAPHGNEA
ncbi:hypothetical protein LCGC14_0074400 [marine sediment metagenome]|uniref:Uncharacterized protein n=1 Tax=marine sediment metagenome TaxID=412755 RepID=A0A0F9YMF6_9ZZZZ|nr:hypothetical protein [Halomonas sp.]HDZ48793.1 hypothetical protein [Halomonas sp.]HEB05458.1 hypothetical protein [Halomonas sp.]